MDQERYIFKSLWASGKQENGNGKPEKVVTFFGIGRQNYKYMLLQCWSTTCDYLYSSAFRIIIMAINKIPSNCGSKQLPQERGRALEKDQVTEWSERNRHSLCMSPIKLCFSHSFISRSQSLTHSLPPLSLTHTHTHCVCACHGVCACHVACARVLLVCVCVCV